MGGYMDEKYEFLVGVWKRRGRRFCWFKAVNLPIPSEVLIGSTAEKILDFLVVDVSFCSIQAGVELESYSISPIFFT